MSQHESTSTPTRLRGDLEVIARQRGSRREVWIANPVSGKVARLSDSDYRRITGGDADDFSQDDGPSVAVLLSDAASHGFLFGPGRPSTASQKPWWSNPLYIRFPGIPADPIARRLARCTGWLFSPLAVVIWCGAFIGTLLCLVTCEGPWSASLGGLADFQARHWVLALLALAFSKIFHELAHAAVCRRMGARCREIGALLLCGAPCLYCDVSDSWRVPRRRGRIAIMLAGVYVEWIIAMMAAWVWMSSEPSPHRMLAFHIMLVCGVSTLMINLNPLMRYDGYYILSDALNLTNLRQRSVEAWRSTVLSRIAGSAYRAPRRGASVPAAGGLCGYFLASAAYRYIVTIALCGWLYVVASRAGLEPIGRVLLIIVAVLMTAGIAGRWLGMLRGRGEWMEVPRFRRGLVACAIACVVATLLFIPFERRIRVSGHVDLDGAAAVFVPMTSTVESVLHDFGDTVSAGDALVIMSSPELEIEHQRNATELRQAKLRYESLIKQSLRHPQVQEGIDGYRTAVTATATKMEITERMRGVLTLVAPRDGMVMRALGQDDSAADAGPTTPRLAPLRSRMGATPDQGAAWCRIGDPRRKQVMMEVDAADRRFVATGDTVRIALGNRGGHVAWCTITDISVVHRDAGADAAIQPLDRFLIACRLPPDVAEGTPVGTTATGVVRGDRLRLWDLVAQYAAGAVW